MPGLNGRFRGDGRLRQVHRARQAEAGQAKPVPAKAVDVKVLLAETFGAATALAIAETVTPFLEHDAAVIADLHEQLRLEKITGDQARRIHEREHRVQERRIEALHQELEAMQSHTDSLRAQLREQRHWERLAGAIVDAARGSKP